MSRSMQSRPQVPDVLVEKVHLGEASDAERAQVLGDPDAKARLDALPSLNAAFLTQYPIDEEVRRIEGRARLQDARNGASNSYTWSVTCSAVHPVTCQVRLDELGAGSRAIRALLTPVASVI